jgi:hypothetical protein
MNLNLQEPIREVEVGIKCRVLQLIESVVHTQKWVGVLTRNLVNATESKRAISTHRIGEIESL